MHDAGVEHWVIILFEWAGFFVAALTSSFTRNVKCKKDKKTTSSKSHKILVNWIKNLYHLIINNTKVSINRVNINY
jgi:hypothetical protein